MSDQTNEDHRFKAFQTAIVACIDYYNGRLDEMRAEIAALTKERDAAVQTAQQLRAQLHASRLQRA